MIQERLLAVTNTFEGTIFVNSNFSAQLTVQDYVAQMFPQFNQEQITAAAAQYTNDRALATNNDKDIGIMGECTYLPLSSDESHASFLAIFICPTYLLLQSFRGPAFKVRCVHVVEVCA